MFKKAFTLIELLIVVLIIAILAAIAVPNFLEFQTRAKVSRAKSDQRSLATAIEAYAVDWNDYPPATGINPLEQRWKFITTPIAYITTFPLDVFGDTNVEVSDFSVNPSDPFYRVFDFISVPTAGSTEEQLLAVFAQAESKFELKWAVISQGPDLDVDIASATLPVTFPAALDFFYDPTNGTVSNGEIFRTGP